MTQNPARFARTGDLQLAGFNGEGLGLALFQSLSRIPSAANPLAEYSRIHPKYMIHPIDSY
jgi:hypothetical protein